MSFLLLLCISRVHGFHNTVLMGQQLFDVF